VTGRPIPSRPLPRQALRLSRCRPRPPSRVRRSDREAGVCDRAPASARSRAEGSPPRIRGISPGLATPLHPHPMTRSRAAVEAGDDLSRLVGDGSQRTWPMSVRSHGPRTRSTQTATPGDVASTQRLPHARVAVGQQLRQLTRPITRTCSHDHPTFVSDRGSGFFLTAERGTTRARPTADLPRRTGGRAS